MIHYEALTLDALCERLAKRQNTLILLHARPDGDAIGSALALRELLRAMGIPALCACADDAPERLRFLTDTEQGSLLLEEGMALDHERVISVDSASPEQLGALYAKFHHDITLMIDHHRAGTPYADYYIDPDACATGEIIYALAKRLCERGYLSEIPKRVLYNVYAAICSDTGAFRFANVTPQTFRVAAELLEAGVPADEICRALYDSKSEKQIRAEGEAACRLNLYDGGKIASTTFPYEVKEELELSNEHLETVIDVPRSVTGALVAFAVKQPDDTNVYRISMRSSADFDVSAVCKKFGGGGHVRAAGCSVRADSVEDAEKKILSAIRESM